MKPIICTLLLAGLSIMTGCSSAVNIQVVHSQRFNPANYQTYAFMDQSGRPARPESIFMNNPELRLLLRDAIEEAMSERGFQRARINDADFLVVVEAGSGDKLRQEMKRWHYRYAMDWRYTDDLSYPPGTLLIDFVDQRENRVFWRGSAEGVLRGRTEITKAMRKAISKLIEAYPPEPPAIDTTAIKF
jgi:hypothetical protein